MIVMQFFVFLCNSRLDNAHVPMLTEVFFVHNKEILGDRQYMIIKNTNVESDYLDL